MVQNMVKNILKKELQLFSYLFNWPLLFTAIVKCANGLTQSSHRRRSRPLRCRRLSDVVIVIVAPCVSICECVCVCA